MLLYFKPDSVLDSMTGSGTCQDVCRELNIPCISGDIRRGRDACDLSWLPFSVRFGLVWLHPPYFRQKVYSSDPRDLSAAPTYAAFLRRYDRLIRESARVLRPGGKLAVLMGDYTDRAEGFLPLVYQTKRLAFAAGLRQCCTGIIRFSHGASSSRKVYRSSFIPGLHDTLCLFERPSR